MRRDDAAQQPPFAMCLTHETDVPEPEVAEPTVDQLGRGARRGAREVACVDERDCETCPRGMGCGGGADDAAAHDQQVELAGRKLIQRFAAAQTATGFAHAFLPAASVTSTRTCRAAAGTFSRARSTSPSSPVARMRPP